MIRQFLRLSFLLLITPLVSGCASGSIEPLDLTATEGAEHQAAHELLMRSVAAHGGDAWAEARDVAVRYRGSWGKIVPKMQPVLSDKGFRSESHEVYWPSSGLVLQEHSGPEGEKRVLRSAEGVVVGYRPHAALSFQPADAEQSSAAALVADAYSLFLFGPSFVAHRAAGLQTLPADTIDGRSYSRMVAALRPGFGQAVEDRVVMWIDDQTGRLFRVLFTLEGFEPARSAEVDVTFLSYREDAGYWWPDQFRERVRAPVRAFAHAWSTEELVVNSGRIPPDVDWAQTTAAD